MRFCFQGHAFLVFQQASGAMMLPGRSINPSARSVIGRKALACAGNALLSLKVLYLLLKVRYFRLKVRYLVLKKLLVARFFMLIHKRPHEDRG